MVAEAKLKESVRNHWEAEVCGSREGDLAEISEHRARTHPYLEKWAKYPLAKNKDVLEIGLGTGIDLCRWASEGARVIGIDLTKKAVEISRSRAHMMGLQLQTMQGDAEALPFSANTFDIVYSFGVLHHTPNTQKAFSEVFRVLRPGGQVKAMIYRLPSLTGLLLAILYRTSQRKAIYEHLESPGTKAYTNTEAREMLSDIGFRAIEFQVELSPGDTLDLTLSAKYRSRVFRLVKALYPRRLVTLFGRNLGLFLLITATKPDV